MGSTSFLSASQLLDKIYGSIPSATFRFLFILLFLPFFSPFSVLFSQPFSVLLSLEILTFFFFFLLSFFSEITFTDRNRLRRTKIGENLLESIYYDDNDGIDGKNSLSFSLSLSPSFSFSLPLSLPEKWMQLEASCTGFSFTSCSMSFLDHSFLKFVFWSPKRCPLEIEAAHYWKTSYKHSSWWPEERKIRFWRFHSLKLRQKRKKNSRKEIETEKKINLRRREKKES